MLKNRVIPCLLLKHGGLIKTRQFADPKYVGDPINAIRVFSDKEVDELIVLDIMSSKERTAPDYSLIEQFASECFMPLCYGGGIRDLNQAKQLFALGVEKISLQTAALENLSLVQRLVDYFGSQSIVISVDVKRNWRGIPKLYSAATGKTLSLNWLDFLLQMVEAKVGEVMLNSVNRDGMMQGIDLDLIKKASLALNVPLIALGGVGSLEHIKQAVDAGANAVAAGAFFVFQGPHRAVLITYPRYEELEKLLGWNV